MNELIFKGLTEVAGMKFNHIEGGFGKGKKAMLAKDIAGIHNRELKDINRNINNNIKRFKEGIDILDLKNGGFNSPLQELGFTSRDISISNNIYLLSERGYSKLLKILEDDFAWEQYEKLVDGYFNMRQVMQGDPMGVAKLLNQQVGLILGEVEIITNRVEHLENNMTIDFGQQQTLQNKAKSKAVKVLGGIKSPAYKDKSISSKVFSTIWKDYKDYFMLGSYRDTLRADFNKALEYLDNWTLQGGLLREIEECNKQMGLGEAI